MRGGLLCRDGLGEISSGGLPCYLVRRRCGGMWDVERWDGKVVVEGGGGGGVAGEGGGFFW